MLLSLLQDSLARSAIEKHPRADSQCRIGIIRPPPRPWPPVRCAVVTQHHHHHIILTALGRPVRAGSWPTALQAHGAPVRLVLHHPAQHAHLRIAATMSGTPGRREEHETRGGRHHSHRGQNTRDLCNTHPGTSNSLSRVSSAHGAGHVVISEFTLSLTHAHG